MRIVHEFSHLGGFELIHTAFPLLETEIRQVIAAARVRDIGVQDSPDVGLGVASLEVCYTSR